ncbi:MAG TPA: hypothetical protein PLI18_03710 [Pirellulaceae bacterium]|nr:hypothetical protein [Pirellulaceae bacterium]
MFAYAETSRLAHVPRIVGRRPIVGRMLGVVGLLVLPALLTGCGSDGPPDTVQDSSIAALARLYGEYASRHSGRGPADEPTFRGFIDSLPEAQRKGMGLDDPAKAFTSPRDGQSLVIVWNVETERLSRSSGLSGYPVVVHESVGRDGRRVIANGFGATAEVDAAGFDAAMSGR